ncbi:MAG: hypothetical protein ACREX4_09635 [Gammaproteobacteria bacterium]
MKKITRILTLVFCCFLALPQAWPQEQSSQGGQVDDKLSKLSCLVTTDFYMVHFTAFQPRAGETDPKQMFRPYCHDLPDASTAYLTLDLVDRDARKMPVGLKLVEEAQGAEQAELEPQRTLMEVPAKVYKHGVVETQADFDKPGHYALLVTIGGEAVAEEDTVRIPLRVGLGTVPAEGSEGGSRGLLVVALGSVVLLAFFGWRFFKRRKQATTSIEP